jgi:catechol 2,3-dioxygenase-like lactoylglutathione lyase family enzyme
MLRAARSACPDELEWGAQILRPNMTTPEEMPVIDHVYISVTDIGRSLAFYSAALQPLGWRELANYDSSSGPDGVPDLYGLADDAYGSGVAVGSSIWLRRRKPAETGLYVGFVADDHAAVDAAYAAAIDAGGKSEGEPAVRSYFGSGYYAANIGDFDDNHLEIVNKSFNPLRRHRAQ